MCPLTASEQGAAVVFFSLLSRMPTQSSRTVPACLRCLVPSRITAVWASLGGGRTHLWDTARITSPGLQERSWLAVTEMPVSLRRVPT